MLWINVGGGNPPATYRPKCKPTAIFLTIAFPKPKTTNIMPPPFVWFKLERD